MLTQLAKFLKVLNSDSNPGQISLAFALGMILGLTPLWSAHNLIFLLLVCIVRINLSAFLVGFTFFSALAYLCDPIFNSLGELLLTHQALQPLWTTLYQSDIWRLLHFNHTLTLGSFVLASISAIPVFIIFRYLIIKYRSHVMAWVEKTKLAKWLKASKFYRLYETLGQGGGN